MSVNAVSNIVIIRHVYLQINLHIGGCVKDIFLIRMYNKKNWRQLLQRINYKWDKSSVQPNQKFFSRVRQRNVTLWMMTHFDLLCFLLRHALLFTGPGSSFVVYDPSQVGCSCVLGKYAGTYMPQLQTSASGSSQSLQKADPYFVVPTC